MTNGFNEGVVGGKKEDDPLKSELMDYQVNIYGDREELLGMIEAGLYSWAVCLDTKSHNMYIVPFHQTGFNIYEIERKNRLTGNIIFNGSPDLMKVEYLMDYRSPNSKWPKEIKDKEMETIIAGKLRDKLISG